jgi:hypothetical protein
MHGVCTVVDKCEICVLNKSMLYKIVSPLHVFKCLDVQIMYKKKKEGGGFQLAM